MPINTTQRTRRLFTTLAAVAIALSAGCTTATGAAPAPGPTGPNLTAYGVGQANQLLRFNTSNPSQIESAMLIKGMLAEENVVGLDFRTASSTTELYALGSSGRLYRIDPGTAQATMIGSGQDPLLTGATQGFDFNPEADRLRIVSGTANRRANPDTGATVDSDNDTAGNQLDTPLAFDVNDRYAGQTPNVTAVAYTNPDANPLTFSTNFAIDATRDVLVHQGTREGVLPSVSPNSGRLYTVGTLNVDAGENSHLDIARNGQAVAVFGPKLYTVDLSTGAATLVGYLATGELRGFALAQ